MAVGPPEQASRTPSSDLAGPLKETGKPLEDSLKQNKNFFCDLPERYALAAKFGVWGLGFGVWGLGSGVCGLRDSIGPGGDTGDMEVAFAEMEERPKEQKDTSFGQAPITCSPSKYDDERRNIADEFRPMMKCALCQKDPTRISDCTT